jgi:hypothetical protein
MSQEQKSAYYRELKDAGVEFTKHYREYTEEELAEAVSTLRAAAESQQPADPAPIAVDDSEGLASFFGLPDPEPELPVAGGTPGPAARAPQPPVRERDPEEMAGQRLNSQDLDEPIRTDEHGRVWYQEEVLKPAFPKPRGRRVLQYTDTGTKMQTVKNGDYLESFEVAGDFARAAEVKITLPSYQVGIYKDPRFPFRVHTYNGNQGFDLFEVQAYYGGAELVPAEIKKVYVENVLAYDVRTTIRAIQAEFRQHQLTGRIK